MLLAIRLIQLLHKLISIMSVKQEYLHIFLHIYFTSEHEIIILKALHYTLLLCSREKYILYFPWLVERGSTHLVDGGRHWTQNTE